MRDRLVTYRLLAAAVSIMGVVLAAGCASHRKHHAAGDEGALTVSDLPPNVQSHFHRDYPNVTIKGIAKETDEGVTHYEIKYVDRSGDERKIEYNREGDEIKEAEAK